jgi:Ca2+/Na+ antiporter
VSRPARIISIVVMLVALALAVIVFVADLLDNDSSTIGVLAFAPALILGASVVGIIAVVDYIVRQLRRRS